ncbi:signal peptidase I [Micrococcus sp.]|uniref:signal peptidase I n=1 Tax=Micrococcus sp. TaxID=1271 RepID=UPI002A912394|nr:signal peptidase I [Micrococcus sp.]MDY6054302.1 signal peptidase I [Micrococcus sp.]
MQDADVRVTGTDAGGVQGAGTPRRRRRPWRAVLVAALTTLAVLALLQAFVVRMFLVPSASMEPTLEPGDRIAVSLLPPAPGGLHRGDVVVFTDTKGWLTGDDARWADPLRVAASLVGADQGRRHVVKRVVGLPGDTVRWQPGWEHLQVNGADLDEPYLANGLAGEGPGFDVTVPEGRLWVLGDHRAVSQDSRQHREGPGGGFVAEEDVLGRAVAVVWPLDRVGLLTADGAAS